ncbi:hypothetical protein [Massilia consociata]|uniref:MASE1 domain-containing protein n=1 Tax=Massilia consociata TaxID=760117 RepID=A0ABV6FIG3_9BURK
MKQPVSQLRMQVYMVAATIVLHGTTMVLNELFFRRAEFLQGIGWIYIPAGTRLLCTLLFGGAGTVGLLITGWFACYWYYFPGDVARAWAGTIAGAGGPYLIYLIAKRKYGLQASLGNLDAQRLLVCAIGCAIASPLLHHIWFMLQDNGEMLGFFVMFVGDLAGSLIVLYAAKILLAMRDGRSRTT